MGDSDPGGEWQGISHRGNPDASVIGMSRIQPAKASEIASVTTRTRAVRARS